MSNKGNIATWSDPIAKKESLAKGRTKRYAKNRAEIGTSFEASQIRNIAESKYKKAGNLLAIHLIELNINPTPYKGLMRRLQTPLQYAGESKLNNAIKRFAELIKKQEYEVLDFAYIKRLVTESVSNKPTPEYLQRLRTRIALNKQRNKAKKRAKKGLKTNDAKQSD